MSRVLVALAVAALAAPGVALAARSQGALLPSPTAPLDTRVPLTARSRSCRPGCRPGCRSRTSRRSRRPCTRRPGRAGPRRQRLTLSGLGDYFFQVAAPVRDVRSCPDRRPSRACAGAPCCRASRRASACWPRSSSWTRGPRRGRSPSGPARVAPPRPAEHDAGAGRGLRGSRAARRPRPGPPGDQESGGAREAVGQPSVVVDGPTTGRRLAVEAPLEVRGARGPTAGPSAASASSWAARPPRRRRSRSPPGPRFALVVTPERRLPELERISADATGGAPAARPGGAAAPGAGAPVRHVRLADGGRRILADGAEASAVYRSAPSPAPPRRPSPTRRTTAPAWGSSSCSRAGSLLLLGGCVVAWAHL